MITVQIVALFLLLIRFISIAFIITVLIKQVKLFRIGIDSDLASFRVVLFLLNIVALSGSILPIYVDYYFAFIHQGEAEVGMIVAYAVSNAMVYLASSILIWKVYQIASSQLDHIEEMEEESYGQSHNSQSS